MTLTGTYLDGSGNPLFGTVTFAPSVPLTDSTDSEIVLQAPVTVAVNSAGQFSVALYGTDDADLAPSGWTWQVTENIAGLTPSTWSFFLAWADGSTQDLSDLAPVAEVTPVAAYLPESGGTMSGTVVLGGSPPLKLPSGTSGYVLTSDSSGDITLQPGGAGGNVLTAFNVKSAPYGAVGNGATDDTAAIASALTAASSGGIVYFPPGVYLVSSPLQITSGITIQGAGATVSVMKGSGRLPVLQPGRRPPSLAPAPTPPLGPALTGCRIADIGFDMTAVNDGTRNQVNAIFQDYCCLQDLRDRAHLVLGAGKRRTASCSTASAEARWHSGRAASRSAMSTRSTAAGACAATSTPTTPASRAVGHRDPEHLQLRLGGRRG